MAEYNEPVQPKTRNTYEYNGRKFVRVKANLYDRKTLSNNKSYKDGDYGWVELQSIKWYKGDETEICFTKDIILAGIPFDRTAYYTGNFESTDMYLYLNKGFIKEVFQYNIENQNVLGMAEYNLSDFHLTNIEDPKKYSLYDYIIATIIETRHYIITNLETQQEKGQFISILKQTLIEIKNNLNKETLK